MLDSSAFDSLLQENLSINEINQLAAWEDILSTFLCNLPNNLQGIALVTAGGSSVALEEKAVRFLTNFSTGGRGAAITEFLLINNWAVIFLCSKSSRQPFLRYIDNLDKESLMSYLIHSIDNDQYDGVSTIDGGTFLSKTLPNCDSSEKNKFKLKTNTEDSGKEIKEYLSSSECLFSKNEDFIAFKNHLRDYRETKHRILKVNFEYIIEYLYLLRLCTKTIGNFAGLHLRFWVFLAAAASDFFIPRKLLFAEKIHGDEPISLNLHCVPKVIGLLRNNWLNMPFTEGNLDSNILTTKRKLILFKLESDPIRLQQKALEYFDRYNCDAIVANLIQDYKLKICVFLKSGNHSSKIHSKEMQNHSNEVTIEAELCNYLFENFE